MLRRARGRHVGTLRRSEPGLPECDEASPHYRGWRVVSACFVMAVFCWGFGFYGQGVYLAELQKLRGWPGSLVAAASTAYYLFSAALVMFVGDAIARLGPHLVVTLGIACLAVSTALVGTVREPWQLFADYGLMAFGWAAMSIAAISTIVGMWFRVRRGLAMSLALNGASVGGIVVAPALVALASRFGLETTLRYAAVVMLVVVGPPAWLWVRRPARDLHAGRVAQSQGGRPVLTRQRALRNLGFWTVSAPFAVALFAQVGFLVHQIAFLEPTLGRAAAGAAVSLTAIMAVVGRVGLGTVIDRLDQRGVSAVLFVSQAAALVVMTVAPNAVTLVIACAVFGFSVGNLITLPTLIFYREFGTADSAVVIALSTGICQFAYAFGPAVVGVLKSASSSYVVPFTLCALLEVMAAAIVLVRPAVLSDSKRFIS